MFLIKRGEYLKKSIFDYEVCKNELENTMKYVNAITGRKSKAVVLKDLKKESNYNKKTNTLYVNRRDVCWLDKLAGLVVGSEEVAKRRKKFWWG